MWLKVKYWGIYEYTPGPNGDMKRLIISREKHSDCVEIVNFLEKSNINFEVYKIEGMIK